MSGCEPMEAISLRKRIPRGLIGDTNIAAIPLFRDTNMAAVTSGENTLTIVKMAFWASAFHQGEKSRTQWK